MIPEFKVLPKILGKKIDEEIKMSTKVIPLHPDEDSRKDNYWFAYILKSKKYTQIKINITLEFNNTIESINSLECIWVKLYWTNYGPFGTLKKQEGFVIPINRPNPLDASEIYFLKGEKCQLLPIKTHVLGALDKIDDVTKFYTKGIIKKGDILTIGETPLAIMQGRYIHPYNIKPSLVSRIICKAFHPTSSLATACGLQVLIDIVGPSRVIISSLIGICFKVIGIKGCFYRFAGKQARLIDDITGTTPPYDQTIVLGPNQENEICKDLSKEIGIPVAIVDVNDLGRVKVLASSESCDNEILKKALKTNPAGNANQQTPLVLVRPC